jgi:nitrogenase molybdenum-iron protein alpha/beta subunit
MIGSSFAVSEGFAKGIPYIELGFPSYSRHCFTEEPFLGFRGALNLTAMLLNSQLSV